MNNILDFYHQLCEQTDTFTFSWPVEFVYNPLAYAWNGFEQYITRYASGHKRVVFLGMNPGPWGMAQTGIPFGEIESVKNFLGITDITIDSPSNQQIKYPVLGLACGRSEVSGKRLWGLFRERFGDAGSFFREHIVLNYCPLLFLARNDSGSLTNYTPDKLRSDEKDALNDTCDECLVRVIDELSPEHVVGIGNFAYKRAREALVTMDVKISKVLHPSPQSPMANRGWSEQAERQLIEAGVWE